MGDYASSSRVRDDEGESSVHREFPVEPVVQPQSPVEEDEEEFEEENEDEFKEEDEEEFEEENEEEFEVEEPEMEIGSEGDEEIHWDLNNAIEGEELNGEGFIQIDSDPEYDYVTDNDVEVRDMSGPERESSDGDDL